MTPEEALKLYEGDTSAEANIRKAITDAYGGLENELNLVRTFENNQMPAFYDTFQGYGAGTGATDLAPSALLARASRNVADQTTAGQVARDAFNVRQAGMEDLIAQGYNQWQQGYTGAQNAYDRWFQQQQFEEQKRQFNAQLARMGSGGSTNPGVNYLSGPSEEEVVALAKKLANESMVANNDNWNAGANEAWNRQSVSNGYSTPAIPTPLAVPKTPFGAITPVPYSK